MQTAAKTVQYSVPIHKKWQISLNFTFNLDLSKVDRFLLS